MSPVKKKVASSTIVSLAAAFAVTHRGKHNKSDQVHEKKPHREGQKIPSRLDGGGTNKRDTQVRHMHAHNQTGLRCCRAVIVVIGTRRRCGAPGLNIGDTSPDYFNSPSLLNARGWSFLKPAKSMRGTQDSYHLSYHRSASHAIYLSFTHVPQRTWEMSIPVSFSTAEGSLVMISSTSPASLAAPTSEPPLDTIVTLFAADSGLLISSAIYRTRENGGIKAVKGTFQKVGS